ncbi:MAG: phage protease [Kiritimatiellaeota bacterium]|nr:phage protease [Kiritimatiellota bacterium]
MNETKMTRVPESGVLRVQIAPFGRYPNVREGAGGKPENVVQVCDRAAFEAVARNSAAEVLVDFDHAAEEGGSTRAAAWCGNLAVEAGGLYGDFRFTPEGAAAVNGRGYRFVSPGWTLDKDGRPDRLVSVALINKPNLPVAPVLNRSPGAATPPGQNGGPIMDYTKIALALGLPETAAEEDILAAIASLTEGMAALQDEAAGREAEEIANRAGGAIKNREAFKALYVKNREAAKALVAQLDLDAPKQTPFWNRRPAPAAAPAPVLNRAQEYDALPPGKAKREFLRNHAAEINRIRTEEKK